MTLGCKVNQADTASMQELFRQAGYTVCDFTEEADVIVANILADIIILLLPDIPGKLKDGGLFFASGIIEDYQQDVTEAAEKVGLRVKEVTRIKDWVGLLMEKVRKDK